MREESPIKKILNSFSSTSKRLIYFIKYPRIEDISINKNILSYSIVDFIMSLVIVFIILRFTKTLLPNFLTINPIALLNLDILGLMLIVNTFIFSLVFYLMFFIIAKIKNIKNINLFFYQAIKTYSILNFIIAIMFIILLDKLITNSMNNWSTFEAYSAILLTIILFYLFFRLLIKPVGKFLEKYFSKRISYFLSFFVILISMYSNQPIFKKYFINVIDKEEFCKQYIEINFKEDIINMRKNKDCMIGKCLQEMENYFENKM